MHPHKQTQLKNTLTDAIYATTLCWLTLCLPVIHMFGKGKQRQKAFFIAVVKRLLWLSKSKLLLLWTLLQFMPGSLQFRQSEVFSKQEVGLHFRVWYFGVFVLKKVFSDKDWSLCCIHVTVCSAVTHLTIFHWLGSAGNLRLLSAVAQIAHKMSH